MVTKDRVKTYHRGKPKLFFSTERILRWMRWYQGDHQEQHPELYAYQQELAERAKQERKRQLLAKAVRLFS